MSAQIVNDVRLVRSMSISSYALLSWDYLSTFQDEVHYIWPSRFSYFKVVFLANRYGNLVFQALALAEHSVSFQSAFPSSRSFCFYFVLSQTLYQCLSFTSVHAMVLMRAWAIRTRSRKLAISLATSFALYIALCVGLFTRGLVQNRHKFTFLAGACTRRLPDVEWLIWFSSLAMELMAFVVTIASLHSQYYKPRGGNSRLSPLVRALYRDSVIFIIANIFSSTFNLVLWVKFPDRPRSFMGDVFSLSLISVTGQRLALGLRKISARSEEVTRSRLSKEIDNQINALLPHLQCTTNINERMREHEVGTEHSGDRPTADLEEARGRSSGEEIEVELRTITQT